MHTLCRTRHALIAQPGAVFQPAAQHRPRPCRHGAERNGSAVPELRMRAERWVNEIRDALLTEDGNVQGATGSKASKKGACGDLSRAFARRSREGIPPQEKKCCV
jgi:hypothetical protein